jgi:hypothetical protein
VEESRHAFESALQRMQQRANTHHAGVEESFAALDVVLQVAAEALQHTHTADQLLALDMVLHDVERDEAQVAL